MALKSHFCFHCLYTSSRNKSKLAVTSCCCCSVAIASSQSKFDFWRLMMVHVCHQLVHSYLHFISVLKASQWRIMLHCCLLSFGPSLPLFLSLVQIGVFPSPGFYPLSVSICMFSAVSFFLFFILFQILLLPPLYSFPEFLSTARHHKTCWRTFEWLSFDNDFFYPLITIWFKRMQHRATWAKKCHLYDYYF